MVGDANRLMNMTIFPSFSISFSAVDHLSVRSTPQHVSSDVEARNSLFCGASERIPPRADIEVKVSRFR
jgi:hypothetical protein